MGLKLLSRVASGALLIAIVCPSLSTQSNPSGYDPANRQVSELHRDSFVDFALKRLNPTGIDYGKCFDEGRSLLVEATVKNAYFWSNVVALGMLGGLFIIVVYQHRIYGRRERGSAEILVQLEQSLARSDAQVRLVTERNLSLAESLSSLKHAVQQPATPSPPRTMDGTPSRVPRSQAVNAPISATTSSKTNSAKPTTDPQSSTAMAQQPSVAIAASPGSQISLFKPEVELVTKVNALEQQLSRSQELEKQLRRQLNDAGRKLQAEQERNRSLKVDPA